MIRRILYQISNIILIYFFVGSAIYIAAKGLIDVRIFSYFSAPIEYLVLNSKELILEFKSPNEFSSSAVQDTNVVFSFIHASQDSYGTAGTHAIVQTNLEDGVFKDTILFSLKNSEILRYNPFKISWSQDNASIIENRRVRIKSIRRVFNSYVFNIKHGPLYNFGEKGDLNWINDDFIFHHSLELDLQKNIWGCGLLAPVELNEKNGLDLYGSIPAVIVKVDPLTGETLFSKGIDSIIDRTVKLKYVAMHEKVLQGTDLWHLNDVQPSPFDTSLVAISLRNINSILLYDYVLDSVIYEHIRPSYQQHDIDFLNDTTLAVFSNNTYLQSQINSINRININTGKVDSIAFALFEELDINTGKQGLFEIHDSILFVEETGASLLHILDIKNNKKLGYYNFYTGAEFPARMGSWIQILD